MISTAIGSFIWVSNNGENESRRRYDSKNLWQRWAFRKHRSRQRVIRDQKLLELLSRFPLRAVGEIQTLDFKIAKNGPDLGFVIERQQKPASETCERCGQFAIIFLL